MNNSYVLILGDNSYDSTIFEEFVNSIIGPQIHFTHNETYDLLVYTYSDDLELKENLESFLFDMNWKMKCFVSKKFDTPDEMYEHVNIILNYFTINLKNNIYDEKTLLNETISVNMQDMKALVLNEYIYDVEMQNIIEAFVENDLNVLKTSKAIFMHRNTLINKLDRFYEKTGYDIRKFKDAYIIYSLIK